LDIKSDIDHETWWQLRRINTQDTSGLDNFGDECLKREDEAVEVKLQENSPCQTKETPSKLLGSISLDF
jgi:hypothetical protein